MANISGIDMNLVLALDALLREASVTRAAQRMGLSQPAMSHALGRLRELLGDSLLVRVGRDMVLTERAEALADDVARTVEQLNALFAGRAAFDPARSEHVFRLAATDYVQLVLLPALDALLRAEAPGVQLVVRTLDPETGLAALRAGDIDMVAGLLAEAAPPDVYRTLLFEDRFVGLARKKHPRVRRNMGLKTFAALPHILVAPRGTAGGVVDRALAQHGLRRQVRLLVPQFLIAPHIVATSDHVVVLAERVARHFTRILPLRVFEPPVALPPMRIHAFWHGRMHEQPAHAWLRNAIRRALAAKAPRPTARGRR